MVVPAITFPDKGEAYSLLLQRLALFIGITFLLFIGIDVYHQLYDFIPYYGAGIFLSGLIIFLKKQGKFELAAILLILTANAFVYLFAASDDPDNGVFFFFIPCVLGSLVLFFPERKLQGIILALVSFCLALIAYLVDWTLIPQPPMPESMVRMNFVINFSFALLSSALILIYMLSKNKEASQHLIEKNAELTKINHELDRFVYSASHDMRAPLTTLLGLIQIGRLQKNENELHDIFDMMTNRIHALDDLLKNITQYSRNAHLEVNNERVTLADLVKSVFAEHQFLADQENIHLEMSVPEDLNVLLDQTRVRLILNNLVSNAIKYHDHLSEKDKWIKIVATINGKDWTMKVTDNGEGIHEDYLPRIFDLFYRASEKSKGSGLGLYIVKETVSKLNGTIGCHSLPGIGSEFVMKMPLVLQ